MEPSALSRTLTGQRRMQLDEMRKFAELFGVPESEVSTHVDYSKDLRKGATPAGSGGEVQTKGSSQADEHHLGFMKEQVESRGAVDKTGEAPGFGESPQAEFEKPVRRHPLFGRLKGVITLAPGVDLTEPADPDLADYLDRKYGPEVRD
jgi:hypothetical protein